MAPLYLVFLFLFYAPAALATGEPSTSAESAGVKAASKPGAEGDGHAATKVDSVPKEVTLDLSVKIPDGVHVKLMRATRNGLTHDVYTAVGPHKVNKLVWGSHTFDLSNNKVTRVSIFEHDGFTIIHATGEGDNAPQVLYTKTGGTFTKHNDASALKTSSEMAKKVYEKFEGVFKDADVKNLVGYAEVTSGFHFPALMTGFVAVAVFVASL